tara:strand:+ start:314 stop:478 length:165 start_codon:yes stop_codon:yes gene_type:complete
MKKSIARIIILSFIIGILQFVNINLPEIFYYVLFVFVCIPLLGWALTTLIDNPK